MQTDETILTSEVTQRVTTVEELFRVHNLSIEDWEITKKVVNTWETSFKNKEGDIVSVPNFQVKVWLQSKKAVSRLDEIREQFRQEVIALSPIKERHYSLDSAKKLLEVNIFDLHLGKIGWAEETGEDYNINIASERFLEAVDFFVDKANYFKVEQILFPIGNDFFNSDYSHPFNRTTKGTPQEEDVRWQKTFKTGRNLIIEAATRLSMVAPVDILMIPGNHDFEKTFYLGDSLEAWFHNDENVRVDNSPSPRKYYQYGKVLIGLTHGSEESINDLPGIMAQEVPDKWAGTYYREFHLGHLHQRKSKAFLPTTEVQGTVVRHMSSLSGTDTWHFKKGYVGARRSAEALVWDKTLGLECNFYFNLPKQDTK